MMQSIVCTSQQSRFHSATLDTSAEIDLHTVNVSIGGTRDLIVDSHLRLKSGVRYALLGRNGTGKSTLFHALANGLIPGIPSSVRILLVSQTDSDSLLDLPSIAETSSNLSALEKVVASDKTRAKALKEFQDVNAALESSSTEQIHNVVSVIKLSRLEDDLEAKKKIASRRSGARGKEARKEEEKAEARLAEVMHSLSDLTVSDGYDPSTEAVNFLADAQATLDLVDYQTTHARASVILTGLGFSQQMIDGPYSSLSGGWRSRCALAAALLIDSHVLLLDEPTNFLDLPSTMWLESYLTETIADRTVVVTSHDQDFLDNVVEETVYIRKQELKYFEGTPAQLELHERKERRKLMKTQGAMDKKKAHMEESIRQGKATAKKTGDLNRLRMAASRQKKLDERWGLEKSAKGGRFKLNRDLAGYHLTNRAEVTQDEQDPPVRMAIPQPAALRTIGDLVTFQDVFFKYPGAPKTLLQDVSFSVPQGGRVAFVGANGHGKSTIVNLILQKLRPISGSITHHPLLRIGHYSQHSVEEIAVATRGKKVTPLKYFLDHFAAKGDVVAESEAMECLGSLGLGDHAHKTTVDGLSGGQKVRLALGLIIFRPPPLLLLDEVTTHLDLATIRGLARALRQYEGAIILITHDRWFCRVVIEGTSLQETDDGGSEDSDSEEDDEVEQRETGSVYRVHNGKVVLMEGGMDEYVNKVQRAMEKRRAKNQGG